MPMKIPNISSFSIRNKYKEKIIEKNTQANKIISDTGILLFIPINIKN
jgi:hypothetical protein